jgi:hypothetical protein
MFKKFRVWNFKRLFLNTSEKGDYHRFGQITLQNIGIIIDSRIDNKENIERKIFSLFGPKSQFSFLYYIAEKNKNIDSEKYFYCVDDINWFYIPKNDAIQSFLSKKYDVMLLFSFENSLHLQYIVNKSEAILKIGYFTSNIIENLFDISLETKKDTISYISEINKTLKIITNTKN